MQGHRNHMEDRTVTRSHFYSGLKSFSLYIVFDGHGGDETANHAKADLADFIIEKGQSIFKQMGKFQDYDADAIVHCKLHKYKILNHLSDPTFFSIGRNISRMGSRIAPQKRYPSQTS